MCVLRACVCVTCSCCVTCMCVLRACVCYVHVCVACMCCVTCMCVCYVLLLCYVHVCVLRACVCVTCICTFEGVAQFAFSHFHGVIMVCVTAPMDSPFSLLLV
jgi:hypothetical protein